jgi:SAM-dependent methyltransferase
VGCSSQWTETAPASRPRRSSVNRAAAKRLIPRPLVGPARSWYVKARAVSARRTFDRARGNAQTWLDASLIGQLDEEFRAPPSYGYSSDALLERARPRASTIQALVPPGGRTLEVGAGDAMVSGLLAQDGMRACALDLSPNLLDQRAIDAGVEFVRADAAQLDWPAETFDATFSFNAFEHFPQPDVVLQEMLRVTRPGGIIRLDFGPLYYSAYGLHGYRTVSIPYAQLLFTEDSLRAYQEQHDLRPIPFDSLNHWPATRFRELWQQVGDQVQIVTCEEVQQAAGIELVRRYPECFASKAPTFDDLLIAIIRISLRRQSAAAVQAS